MRSEESQLAFAIAFADILRELTACDQALSQLIPFLAPFEEADPRTVHDEVEAVKALAVIEQSHQHLEDIHIRCRAFTNTLATISVIQDLSPENLDLKARCDALLAKVIQQSNQVSTIHGKLRARAKRPYH